MSDNQLKSIMERILRLHEEVDNVKGDIREVYAEARSMGYDKAAMGEAIRIIRKREKDSAAFEERTAIVELYLSTFDQPSHVPARERTHEATEYQPTRLLAERDPQSAQHGSDSEGGAGGESPTFSTGSEQDSAKEPQARNEPGSEGAASGGEGLRPLPETPLARPYDPGPIPAFLDRRVKREQVEA